MYNKDLNEIVNREVSQIYGLQDSTKAKLKYLSDLLKIPYRFVENGGDLELTAMSFTIIYRHLDRWNRLEAMKIIRTLPNKQLENKIITRILDTTFINPQWGMWSMTNKQLMADEAFHAFIDGYASTLGVTISIAGFVDFLKKLREQKKITHGGVITLVIWVALISNSNSLNATRAELVRRTALRTSTLHR